MARKKQAPTAVSKPASSTSGSPKAQLSIINLKGTEAYREWVAGFTRHTHITAATMFRLGMVEMARKHGYETPPEK